MKTMNAPRTPNPLIRRVGIAIWMIEDIRLIYDEENEMWWRQQLDVPKNGPATHVRTGFVDKFLAFYGLSTAKLIQTLED